MLGLGRDELESLTVLSASGGRMTRGFEMAGFLSRNDLVTLLAGAVRTTVIAGGAAGNHTVAGIDIGDALRAVLHISMGAHAAHGHDITTVAAIGGGSALTEPAIAGPLETAGAGQTNPDAVDVLAAPQDHTWAVADITTEFTITTPNTINNTGGTDTTGDILIVVYEDLTP